MDASEETRYDRQKRLQRANDRNAVIAFVLGLVLLLGNLAGVAVGATTGDSAERLAMILMGIGVLLIVLGLFFKGRKVR